MQFLYFFYKEKLRHDLRVGAVSDLLVFISDLARFNEVKSSKVRPRIHGVIKIAFV